MVFGRSTPEKNLASKSTEPRLRPIQSGLELDQMGDDDAAAAAAHELDATKSSADARRREHANTK